MRLWPPVLVRQGALVKPEAGQLELIEEEQLLPPNWRLLYEASQGGVVLGGEIQLQLQLVGHLTRGLEQEP